MSSGEAIRLWLGWRAGHLAGSAEGWIEFKKSLARTFIPVTWETMTGFGLNAYVPSVFSPTSGAGLPEEVALLSYASPESYAASKDTVLGRAYATMHRAVFEFDAAGRVSKSGWAGAPTANKPTLRAAAPGGKRFDDKSAVLHVLLLSVPGQLANVQALLHALAPQQGSVALWCQPGFAVVWVAATGELDKNTLAAALVSAHPGTTLAAFHQAQIAPAITQKDGVPVVDRQSWHFHA